MTTLTVNGVSTTKGLGSEQYEEFEYRHTKMIQYDYRHTDGTLFSGIHNTLKGARKARDLWLTNKAK